MEFYREIERKLNHKDVGLVILNSGLITYSYLGEIAGSDLTPVLDTNIYHVAALMKLFLPTLHNREKRLMEEGNRNQKTLQRRQRLFEEFVEFLENENPPISWDDIKEELEIVETSHPVC